ncbi:MAG: indole-3-glycerol phosphate synthase TrpC [Microbacter sp.]
MNILETIIQQKKAETAIQKKMGLLAFLGNEPHEPVSLKKALQDSTTGIIAEFKRKSPSKRWIFPEADVKAITKSYVKAGATGISVLTDETFFGGSIADLKKARSEVSIPMLRKDFIIDPFQIDVAKAIGADVVLLIAAALPQETCRQLADQAHHAGLEVLLEIHDEAELEYIHDHIDVVGINNRNLKTFVTDVETSFRLGEKIPKEMIKISESGISDPQTIKNLRAAGFNGFLMGEAFMKNDDPGKALSQLIDSLK